jgi:hypothetical protein
MTNWHTHNGEETHKCTAERKGDWITFRCPHCKDYVRHLNYKTGEMIAPKRYNPYKHTGTNLPIGLQPEMYNPN